MATRESGCASREDRAVEPASPFRVARYEALELSDGDTIVYDDADGTSDEAWVQSSFTVGVGGEGGAQ